MKKLSRQMKLELAGFMFAIFVVCWVIGIGIAAYLNARDGREMRQRTGTPPSPSGSPGQHAQNHNGVYPWMDYGNA
jgi:hypothetical protein